MLSIASVGVTVVFLRCGSISIVGQPANRKGFWRNKRQGILSRQTMRTFGLIIACLLVCCAVNIAQAADIQLPVIDPIHTIEVEAETVARDVHGKFEVLAFQGNCQLTQGGFTANADEIILWIDQEKPRGIDAPGQIVCYLDGNARARWPNGQQLSDQRWMGRLFSLHPVVRRGKDVVRHDIPNLNWNRESSSAPPLPQFVRPVQYSQAPGEFGGVSPAGPVPAAPPLLGPNPTSNSGFLPAPRSGASSQVPTIPGAVQWQGDGGQVGSSRTGGSVPQYGLPIPLDGSSPYSEPFTSAPATESISPILTAPRAPQVVRQVPAPDPLRAKSIQLLARSTGSTPKLVPEYIAQDDETVRFLTGGFRLVVNGLQVRESDGSMTEYGTISLEADNAIVWQSGKHSGFDGGFTSTPEQPIELYLEGNIVFHQGNRVIYADRMYFNVSSEYGMVLSAEVLTPVPQYQGLLRLKADVIQMRDRRNLMAYGAAVTSSRMGVPRYWMQTDEVALHDTRDESDLSVFAAGDKVRDTKMQATASNNFVYVGGVPVLYWPTFSTDLSKSSFYLSSLKFKNDSIFGFQTYVDWDVYQLLGIEGREGTSFRLSTDYLSDRGPAIGARYDYNRPTMLFGIPGTGFTDSWFIRDDGLDYIGSDRSDLVPEEDLRGRVLSRHRLYPAPNWELMLETGWISDRNFLEQYFENEWEQEKDFDTALRARRYNGNRQFEVFGQARVNDFFTESEWLPRFDHYWLGQDLFAQRATWSAHTSVAYAHQRTASTPTAPDDAAKFALLPWESESEGARLITRQELSMPFSAGAWKLIPFLSGEAGFWNEDINQDDVTRLTGQAGIRAALPMWKVYPNIENRLFDLRGIAHKATFEAEYFYADSNANLDLMPLYDPLDDNSQEHFRRRFIFNTFGGALPPEFDERNFALRSGMQRWITAGSSEVVDDMSQMRFGFNQRWQTKRGLPGQERIVDLVSFDVDFVLFPRAQRDNFGEDVGVINYDFRYHVGDRLTLLSDGYFDTFSQGLKTISAGAQMSRPGVGDAYLGVLSIEGPISANIVNGYVNYRMNEKWIFNGGAAFDFGDTGSIGQTLGLTRIGESALIRVGVNVDHGRDNVSFGFNIEPRFLPTVRLGQLGGELIPPAGLYGFE